MGRLRINERLTDWTFFRVKNSSRRVFADARVGVAITFSKQTRLSIADASRPPESEMGGRGAEYIYTSGARRSFSQKNGTKPLISLRARAVAKSGCAPPALVWCAPGGFRAGWVIIIHRVERISRRVNSTGRLNLISRNTARPLNAKSDPFGRTLGNGPNGRKERRAAPRAQLYTNREHKRRFRKLY